MLRDIEELLTQKYEEQDRVNLIFEEPLEGFVTGGDMIEWAHRLDYIDQIEKKIDSIVASF